MFECQHGTIECYGNKVHACTLVKVKDVATQLKYIGCMIDDNYNPNSIGAEVSAVFNLYIMVTNCMSYTYDTDGFHRLYTIIHFVKFRILYAPTLIYHSCSL